MFDRHKKTKEQCGLHNNNSGSAKSIILFMTFGWSVVIVAVDDATIVRSQRPRINWQIGVCVCHDDFNYRSYPERNLNLI